MNRLFRIIPALFLIGALSTPALASQGSCILPTSGTVSGLTLVQKINDCSDAIQTANSGATAPTNTSGAPGIGQLWLDTSATPVDVLKIYDGASWLPIAAVDATNHVWDAPIGGGTATLASATTTDLCSVPQSVITISGTTAITGFSNTCQPGQIKALVFSGALTLTSNVTSMILPNGGSDITTVAGDRAWAAYLGGGNWEVVVYQRADGTALNASAIFTGAVYFDAPITVTLGVNTNNWTPAGLGAANVIRLTCSSAINITGLTASATDGKLIDIDNVGASNNCTFTAQDASSTAANRFAFDRPIALRPGRSMIVKYDLTGARWRLAHEIAPQGVAGTVKNLLIVNGATPNNQLTVTYDEVIVEDGNGGTAKVASGNCTADITSSGAGGLDTGAVAQGQGYYLWVIFAPATNTQSCLFSTASTLGSVTLPSGYTFAARLGWDYVENAVGKRLNRIMQMGRLARYVVTASSATASMPIMFNGPLGDAGVPTWVAVTVAGVFAPATASRLLVSCGTNGTSGNVVALVPNNSYGAYTNATNPPPFIIGANGTNQRSNEILLESASVYAGANASDMRCFARGWEDTP